MARGVARSVDDRINEIDVKIQKKQDELNTLKEKRKELVDTQRNELALQIAQLAEEKGLSLDELFKTVQSK